MATQRKKPERQPIGLNALLGQEPGIPLPSVLHFTGGSQREEKHLDGRVEITIPARAAPADTRGHLEYALKHEAVDCAAWYAICHRLGPEPFQSWILEQPTGKHARRAWCLYEWLTGQKLDVPNSKVSNYVLLGNGDLQVIANVQIGSYRHRVFFNLLGDNSFCPLIRLTDKLKAAMASDLRERTRKAVEGIGESELRRAIDYLYHKETKASYQIEREDASTSRVERFIDCLRSASVEAWQKQSHLIQLQNTIVEERYAESAWRSNQVYVGQTLPWGAERVHYPCPKPEDVAGLMSGWEACHLHLWNADPVCKAAIMGFGFVFIHPFEDGNGRIHRFVIHATLAERGFAPKDVVIPISATMLRRRDAYDAALEAFSKSIMPFVDYTLDEDGVMTVKNETAHLYRFWDATPQCEYLYEALRESVEVDLPEELKALSAYDSGLQALLQVVDMPDRRAHLFMRLLLHNSYRLSKSKRDLFPEISDEEIQQIEQAVREAAEMSDAKTENLELDFDSTS